MDFVFRRIAHALKFRQDDAFMRLLHEECEFQLSCHLRQSTATHPTSDDATSFSYQAKDALCFALILDLAGNVLAHELSVEGSTHNSTANDEDTTTTKQLRRLITDTFTQKQLAVRALPGNMSRADFSNLKTEVLSCIIDELIPSKSTSSTTTAPSDEEEQPPQQEEDQLTVEALFQRKDQEIRNAHSLVLDMERKMKREWEDLRAETQAIVREAQHSLAREQERAAGLQADLERANLTHIAQEQKRQEQHAWELQDLSAKHKKLLGRREHDLAAQHANTARQHEFQLKLDWEAKSKQQWEAQFEQWKLEHAEEEDKQYSAWRQEFLDEQEDANQEWRRAAEAEWSQFQLAWRAQEEEKRAQYQQEVQREHELKMQSWLADEQGKKQEWQREQETLAESFKLGFLKQQEQQNAQWRKEWRLSTECRLELERIKQEWIAEEHVPQLAKARAEWERELAEQAELDEVLVREKLEAAVQGERQRSVLDKVQAIEHALKQQRVRFEEERAKTVNKLCVDDDDEVGEVKPALKTASSDLRVLLEDAQTVHRQLEAITLTLRNAKQQQPSISPSSSNKRRVTVVVAQQQQHTPMDKRRPVQEEEQEEEGLFAEARRLDAQLISSSSQESGDEEALIEVDLAS